MAASGLRAMKRVAKWSLVLVSGCLLAVLILGPWLALLLWTLFHNTKPPQIAEGIIPTSGRRDYAAIGAGLNSALQRTFPVGTSEAVLVSTLQRQGFKPLPPPPADCLPPGQRPPIGGGDQPRWGP